MSVNLDQIVVSDKFKHSDEAFKYFIGYQEGELLNLYVLSYLKWVDTSNTLKTGAKTCLPWLKMMKCEENTKKFDGVIKTTFLGNDTPKENMHYTSITIFSVMGMDKKTIRRFI